jgi:hypothetical protein
MDDRQAEGLLNRVNAKLAEHRKVIEQAEKRLTKAPNQKAALAIRSSLAELHAQKEVLKAQQKALKRGILPGDLNANGDKGRAQ